MTGPNSDLTEIFNSLEDLPKRPAKLISGFLSWAKGEQDPDWNKRGKKAAKKR